MTAPSAAAPSDKSLTVLQVLPALEGGGVERGTLDVAAGLVAQGHRSLVLSAGGRLLPELLAGGSEHITCPLGHKSPLTLRYLPQVRRLLATAGIDIVHVRSRLPAWLTWLAWSSLSPQQRPALVTGLHGLYSVNRYSAVMTRGERVIAVSETARDHALANYPKLDAQRVRVICPGVDPTRYSPDFRPRPAWQADWYRRYPALRERFVITLPGRVSRRKGVFDFIAILAELKQAGHVVHGLVVGDIAKHDRTLARRLRAASAAAGIDDVISFTGFREDVREIMSVSDAVVSLSHHPEAWGRTVNEALALGTPVAGYAHGGVGEQLQRQFPAGAVPPGDTAGLVACLGAWCAQRPTLDGVQPCLLPGMLRETLSVYRELAG